jgi:hypothetical protein
MAGQLVDTYQAPMIKVATKNTVFWQVYGDRRRAGDAQDWTCAGRVLAAV